MVIVHGYVSSPEGKQINRTWKDWLVTDENPGLLQDGSDKNPTFDHGTDDFFHVAYPINLP